MQDRQSEKGDFEQSPKHTETEVKLYVENHNSVTAHLLAAGGSLVSPRVYERNVRYDDASGTLNPAGKVLRLRQDDRVRLTYKAPRPAWVGLHGSTTRTEIEVEVSDFEATDLLLQALGFAPVWIYEKYRTTYQLAGCEVVLDELPCGCFVEIEGSVEAIGRALGILGLEDMPPIPDSYSEIFNRVKVGMALPFRDFTFTNFAEITVPPTLILGSESNR